MSDESGQDDDQDGKALLRWRLARAGIIGLLIGAVVILFSHLGH